MKNLILFLAVFILGCGEWGGELIKSDYEPELNIFGLLNLNEYEESFIIVTRTAKLEENVGYSWDYIDYYNNNMTSLEIEDAEVFIYDEFQDTIQFYFSNSRYIANGFEPKPETKYNIVVNARSENLFATGSTTTPSIIQFQSDSLADTLIVNENFQLNWDSTLSPLEISISEFNIHWESNFCIERELYYYTNGETTDEFDIDLCDFYVYYESYPVENYMGVSFNLRAFDQNYYDYFILNDDSEFINFIIGQPGATAKSFGINGGLGVFGSISSDNFIKILRID